MTVKLICGDGKTVPVPKEYFEKGIFTDSDIAKATSYTLESEASSKLVKGLLDWISGASKKVPFTEENVDEAHNLCWELGYEGLKQQFAAFFSESGTGSNGSDGSDGPDGPDHAEEVSQLRDLVNKQQRRLDEMERRLQKESELREALSRQVQSLEKKLQDLARAGGGSPAKSAPARAAPPAQATPGHRKQFLYSEAKKLDGIIAYLTRECGGNVHDKGIVDVSASTVPSYVKAHPKNVVDLLTDNCYYSADKENSWICYDFKDRRVIPTSYSVRSGPGRQDDWHLKNWTVEVSNTGTEGSWTEIDDRFCDETLNGRFRLGNFKIPKVGSEAFRFFRLRQSGINHADSEELKLCALEIFGTLCE